MMILILIFLSQKVDPIRTYICTRPSFTLCLFIKGKRKNDNGYDCSFFSLMIGHREKGELAKKLSSTLFPFHL